MGVTTPSENTTNPSSDAHLAVEVVSAAGRALLYRAELMGDKERRDAAIRAFALFGIEGTRETRASFGIPQDS